MRRHLRCATPSGGSGTAATEGADDDEEQVDQSSFEHAKIIIEFNYTDSGVGVQAFLGGPPWEVVEIVSPDGRKVFHVDRGSLEELGMPRDPPAGRSGSSARAVRIGKAEGPNPTTHGRWKSDPLIVPVKPPTEAEFAAAEVVEGRGGAMRMHHRAGGARPAKRIFDPDLE
jgi:hypothetical protein